MRYVAWLVLVVGCGTSAPIDASQSESDAGTPTPVARHSSSIALSADETRVFVVNADVDSVSVVDVASRARVAEIALATTPAVDPVSGRFEPAIGPRSLALASGRLYVTGEWSGELVEIDLATAGVSRRIAVGSEPIGVVISADQRNAFVACAQDAIVVRVDLTAMHVTGTVTVAPKPWALGWSGDGTTLWVSHLLGPGVTAIDPEAMRVTTQLAVPDAPGRGDRLLAYGEARGLYDVVARPGTDELWVPHLLLATDTQQVAPPAEGLDFESTVFPAITVLGGTPIQMSVDSRLPGVDGALGDVVSGPHAIELTPDGRFAFVLDAQSEDVLVVDAERRVEVGLFRPLPGHLPEGLVLSRDGSLLFVDERATLDVAVLSVTLARDPATGLMRPELALEGDAIPRVLADPMPAAMRLGQTLFFSANSEAFPVTQNHWVACASCHLEGRSDAVVWRFAQGPRDTPSNAGGVLHTGFLFRTADRRAIQDYWHTIRVEQGGAIDPDDPPQAALLDALERFVDAALPRAQPPHTDASLVARGRGLFERADVGCATCHAGEWSTDSGAGNPSLDLGGAVVLHDVGTCNVGDVAHLDVDGHPRMACAFDTPSLRGVADSWPYLHDGSAATLRDVLVRTRGTMGHVESLDDDDLDALVEYLRSL